MMTEKDVTKLLRQIGPHVSYSHVEALVPGAAGVRTWLVREHPHGGRGKMAHLALQDGASLDEQDWPSVLAEGAKRYEASAEPIKQGRR